MYPLLKNKYLNPEYTNGTWSNYNNEKEAICVIVRACKKENFPEGENKPIITINKEMTPIVSDKLVMIDLSW